MSIQDKDLEMELRNLGVVINDDDVIKHIRESKEEHPKNDLANYSKINKKIKPSVYVTNPLQLNKMTIVVQGDDYHQIYVDTAVENTTMSITSIELKTMSDLEKYKQYTKRNIFNSPEILFLKVNMKLTSEVLKFITAIYMKNKSVFLFLYNFNASNFIRTYFSDKNLTFSLKYLEESKTYAEKKELVSDILSNMKIRFDNKKTKELLIKIIISKPNEFKTIKSSLDISLIQNFPVNTQFLEDIAGTIDFYNLQDFYFLLLRGCGKQKFSKYLNHFLNVKKYSPNWILENYKEFLFLVNDFYFLYYNGYIKHSLDKFTFNQRLSKVNIAYKQDILKLSKREQEELLTVINDVPYNYLISLIKLVNDKKFIPLNHLTFNQLLLETYVLRSEYKEFVDKNNVFINSSIKYFKK